MKTSLITLLEENSRRQDRILNPWQLEKEFHDNLPEILVAFEKGFPAPEIWNALKKSRGIRIDYNLFLRFLIDESMVDQRVMDVIRTIPIKELMEVITPSDIYLYFKKQREWSKTKKDA